MNSTNILEVYKKALVLIKIHALQHQHEEVVELVDGLISKEEFADLLKDIIKE